MSASTDEVAVRFGVLPNFFRSAPAAPGLIEELWAFARAACLDSPPPSLFKERDEDPALAPSYHSGAVPLSSLRMYRSMKSSRVLLMAANARWSSSESGAGELTGGSGGRGAPASRRASAVGAKIGA